MRAIHGRQASWLGLIAVSVGLVAAACAKPEPVTAPPTPSATASPTASPTPSATPCCAPTPPPTSGPVKHTLAGSLYYAEVKVQRITNSTLVTVLNGNSDTVTVSPDGRSLAFVSGTDLEVTTRDGHPTRTVLGGVVGVGFEPAWSPDSTKVLVMQGTTIGTVDVHTNHFTPLAHDPGGIHYLWSADGQHLGYATGTCQIGIADADGGHARLVPVLGDLSTSVNPKRMRSCDPYSISPDGSRMAVSLHTGDMPDGDIGRGL